MSIKKIYVNQGRISQNRNEGTNHPVITVEIDGVTTHCYGLTIKGESRLVYNLQTGVSVHLQTEAEIEYENPFISSDQKKD